MRTIFRSIAVSTLFFIVPNAYGNAGGVHPWALDYTFAPHLSATGSWLDVRVHFTNAASGTSLVDLPSQFASASNLYDAIVDLRPLSADTQVLDTGDPAVKRVVGMPGAELTLSYRVTKNWSGPLTHSSGNYFRALLEPDYALFLGPNALIVPEWDQLQPRRLSFHWKFEGNAPEFGGSYGVDEKDQSTVTTLADLNNAAFYAGNFRRSAFEVNHKPVEVLIRGDWPFADARLKEAVSKIIATERTFWNDNAFPFYFVLLTSDDEPLGTSGGTGYTNAFVLYEPPASPIDFEMYHAIAHEYFHTWNPGKIGIVPSHEELFAWFYEGFTEFYTSQMVLRAGLITPARYMREVARKDKEYETFPNRNAPNSAIEGKAYTNAYYNLPYLRGERLARYWNERICASTNGTDSLDTFMRSLFVARPPLPRMDSDYVARALSRYIGAEAGNDIARYVDRGETVPRAPATIACKPV